MLEVRWFFRVQILCHSGYWRVVPNPISLEYGEKVFQVFFPLCWFPPAPSNHAPFPPTFPQKSPNSPMFAKNEQPNLCGAVQERISSSIQRVEIPHCHSKMQKIDRPARGMIIQSRGSKNLPKVFSVRSPISIIIFSADFEQLFFSEILCIFC